MSTGRTTVRTRRVNLALTLLAVSCVGGVGYAVAQSVRSPASSQGGDPPAANSPYSRTLSIRVTPAEQSVAPGGTVAYRIQVRHRGGRRVTLSVLRGLPDGAVASFDRTTFKAKKRLRSGSGATLTVDTTGAPSGGHRLRLLASSGARRAIAPVNLLIRPQQPTNFSISGDLADTLEPALTVPLELVLTNPGPVGLAVTDLGVGVTAIDAPLSSEAYPCTIEDFSVTQFSGTYGFALGAEATSSLGQLGFPPEQWPQVTMLDRPVNQNGCKGASLEFDFTGTAGSF